MSSTGAAASALHTKNDVHDSLHFAEPLGAEPLRPVTSHVCLLGNRQASSTSMPR
jgi:hypothetical protein